LITDISTGMGNAALANTTANPTRCGIFAASSPNHTREETGGGYYGVMELTGNVNENCVTIGAPAGRAYDGRHGNGTISLLGEANVAGWPLSTDVTGIRGGSFASINDRGRVSARLFVNAGSSPRNGGIGGRGVRTAP
jgi:formylglycine-generating enzyme required for sulfatase activity